MQRLVSALFCATAMWLLAASVDAQAPVPPAPVIVMNPTGDASVSAALLGDVRTELEALVRARPDLRLSTSYTNGRGFVIQAHVTITGPSVTVALTVHDASLPGAGWTVTTTTTLGGRPTPGRGARAESHTVVLATRDAWRNAEARIRP